MVEVGRGKKKEKTKLCAFLQLLFPIVAVTIIFTYEERLKWSREIPIVQHCDKEELKRKTTRSGTKLNGEEQSHVSWGKETEDYEVSHTISEANNAT